jgi:hypothetical protein
VGEALRWLKRASAALQSILTLYCPLHCRHAREELFNSEAGHAGIHFDGRVKGFRRHWGIQAKSFRLPSAAELLFSCVAKRKVTKREGHPAWRSPGLLPGKSVRRGRAFRTGILPVRKGVDLPVDSRCAACRPRLTAAQGPRVKQRAILARTFQESLSTGKSHREKIGPGAIASKATARKSSLAQLLTTGRGNSCRVSWTSMWRG